MRRRVDSNGGWKDKKADLTRGGKGIKVRKLKVPETKTP